MMQMSGTEKGCLSPGWRTDRAVTMQEREIEWSETMLAQMYGQRDRTVELIKCHASPVYFVHEYVWIYNATVRSWVKMRLWPAQAEVLRALDAEQYLIVLKARQLGMSWLAPL